MHLQMGVALKALGLQHHVDRIQAVRKCSARRALHWGRSKFLKEAAKYFLFLNMGMREKIQKL